MDVKALAKSKRAHSSHHSKKHHPPRAAKVPSPANEAVAAKGKQTGKKVKEKAEQPSGSKALPSNWAQYDEEDDTDSENAQGSLKKATDVVMPKSKGADYSYLVSEAKAQAQTIYTFDDPFDHVPDDIHQGQAPLLTMRGQGILSMMDDDYFDFKDEATDNYEAPFLSLDLNALAEQIAKANLAERLYIEPDLLPPEMYAEYAEWQEKQNKFDDDKVRSDDQVTVNVSDELHQTDVVGGSEVFRQHPDYKSSNTMASKQSAGGWEDHVKDNNNQVEETSQHNLSNSNEELDMVPVAKKPSKFEAVTAQAELDMLLDSFGETNFFESSIAENRLEDVLSIETVKKVSDKFKSSALTANFNDDIDELLKETSTSTSISVEVNAAPKDLPLDPDPASKSKLLDDFDSWLDTI